jgi:hypothetical protein
MGEKTIDCYMSVVFPIKCRGRDYDGKEVLKKPTDVKVKISKSPAGPYISLDVECSYNTGGHGQRCGVPDQDREKIGEGVFCVYSLDLPHAMDVHQKIRSENSRLKEKVSDLEKMIKVVPVAD